MNRCEQKTGSAEKKPRTPCGCEEGGGGEPGSGQKLKANEPGLRTTSEKCHDIAKTIQGTIRSRVSRTTHLRANDKLIEKITKKPDKGVPT